MEPTCNIVELIENNPITKLSNTYQNKLLTKIKDKFSDSEQQLFVSSFYCFLNYNQRNDFVIDLDNIWSWIGFSQKDAAKRTLDKHFTINTDYKIFAPQVGGAIKNTLRGGHNKEIIMLTVRTFKLFCLKAGTKKAEQIHEYYIKLEETLQEVIQEESDELKMQLEAKTLELQKKENNNDAIREKTLLEQFPINTQCFYYGIIDNVSKNNEKIIKFGNSNNLKSRVLRHKDTYTNFWLMNAFKVDNKIQIENAFKDNSFFKERMRTILIKSKNYVELLNIDGLSFTELDKIIKDIISKIEYSPENYIKILEENQLLKKQIDESNKINKTHDMILLTSENKQLKIDNLNLIKKFDRLKTKMSNDPANYHVETENPNIQHPVEANPPSIEPPVETENYIIDINNFNKKNKKITKNSDGFYYVNGVKYNKLYGSRQDVWDKVAFQTTGCLTKLHFTINKNGKIVSKKKSIQEMQNNKFFIHGVNNLSQNEI
jgi:hypothetical protein